MYWLLSSCRQPALVTAVVARVKRNGFCKNDLFPFLSRSLFPSLTTFPGFVRPASETSPWCPASPKGNGWATGAFLGRGGVRYQKNPSGQLRNPCHALRKQTVGWVSPTEVGSECGLGWRGDFSSNFPFLPPPAAIKRNLPLDTASQNTFLLPVILPLLLCLSLTCSNFNHPKSRTIRSYLHGSP